MSKTLAAIQFGTTPAGPSEGQPPVGGQPVSVPEERKTPSPGSFKLGTKQDEQKDSQKTDSTLKPKSKSKVRFADGVEHTPGPNTFRVKLDTTPVTTTGKKNSSPP